MASRREMEALIRIAGRMDPSLQRALRQTQRELGNTSRSSNLMGKVMGKAVGLAAKGVAIGTGVIGAALAYAAKEGVQLASDLTEVQNVVDVAFGKSAKQINSWSKTALNSYGLSELSAKQYAGTMGAMLKSSGLTGNYMTEMSTKLTGLAGDFASFYNVAQDDAWEKIRSGISGETEPLKALGINMSVANLEAYALAKGIKTSYQKMDQASQTALRYSYLMNASKDAQGDFARTQGSFANQTRLLKTNFQQLSAKLMGVALPALIKIAQAGNKILNGALGNPEFIAKFQGYIQSFSNEVIKDLPKVINWFQGLGPKLKMILSIAGKLYNFVKNNWSLITPIIWGIVAAQIAFNVAAKAALIIETVTKAIQFASAAMLFYRNGATLAQLAQWALNAAMAANPIGIVTLAVFALVAAGVTLYKNWDKIGKFAGIVWDGIKKAFFTAINFIIGYYNGFIKMFNHIPGVHIPLIPTVQMDAKTKKILDDSGTLENEKLLTKKQTISSKVIKAPAVKSVAKVTSYMNKFALGGLARRASIFGEAGPEMAIPIKYKNPRSLSLLNQTAKAIGADKVGSKPSVVMNLVINAAGGTARDIKEGAEMAKDYIIKVIDDYLDEKESVSLG